MVERLMDRFKLDGRAALVTGGGSGMGKEFARILAEAGATVMIAARNEERLRETARELQADTGSTVLYRVVDLEDTDEAEALVRHAQEAMGRLDILVGNAAADLHSTAENFDADRYRAMHKLNMESNVWMTRAAVPAMKQNEWGRIIFITSLASASGYKNLPLGLYGSTKAGLESFARYIAVELARSGITVNCLAPGGVETPMRDGSFGDISTEQLQATWDYISSLIPMNRFARPDELAGLLLLLASDAGSYITGHRYAVDGGWTHMGDTLGGP